MLVCYVINCLMFVLALCLPAEVQKIREAPGPGTVSYLLTSAALEGCSSVHTKLHTSKTKQKMEISFNGTAGVFSVHLGMGTDTLEA